MRRKLALIILVSVFLCSQQSGQGPAGETPQFSSFYNIPGATQHEISAVEALREKGGSLIYGALPSTETFINEGGEIDGYSALLCDWLSSLFGLNFRPGVYEWSELIAKLNTGEIDFTNLQVREDRLRTYFMTDPVAQRSLKIMRIEGSPPLDKGAPRFVFLEGSAIFGQAAAVSEPGAYEAVFAPDYEAVYRMLKNGDADAFIAINTTEAAFDNYGGIQTADFSPLVFFPVSLATANAELAPLISLITKALKSGGIYQLNDLYKTGYRRYKHHRFLVELSEEEREYLHSSPVVPMAGEYWFYPVSFYNVYNGKWEGIAHDILAEIENITGIKFKLAHGRHTNWPEIMDMLRDGKAHIVTDLIYTTERKNEFIWAKNSYLSDRYALLSKQEFPDIGIVDIPYAKIGLIKDTAQTDAFRDWFPAAQRALEYETQDAAFNALERGEVDLVMASTFKLISMTDYYHFSGYKANYVFNSAIEYAFGFNREQRVLRSIVDKAFPLINIEQIVDRWVSANYDYEIRLIRAQRPWLIGVLALSVCVLVLLAVFLARSISSEKKLEELVRKRTSELEFEFSKLAAILDSSPDIMFCKDLNLRYIQCNRNYAEAFNIRAEDIKGKMDAEIFDYAPDLAQKFIEDDKSVMSEKRTAVFEDRVVLKHKSGEESLLETIKTPLMQNNEVIGVIGIARDITQRKAMEEAALAASRSKTAFLATMSHEMRTPMNVVVGLTDLMLEDETLSPNAKDNLKKISTAGNTLQCLINDVLDISKIEAGKLELMPVQYNIPSLLNDIITLNMIHIEDKPVSFKLNIGEELPANLYGDDLRVKQVINNLLSNAFKYTQKGTVTLALASERGEGDSVRLSGCVSDTGIGIRPEDITKLFSDYNQVDTRANRLIGGTGLGLSITKMLVERMGGDISVESEYGKGASFSFSIRQKYVDDKTIGAETAENLRTFRYADKRKSVSAKLVRPDLSYASVLVVDDMQTNLDVAVGLLRKYKMRVDCALSGADAVALIEKREPIYDAIFMDHMMPGMDGVEAAQAIRAIGTEYALTIPIIALTANAIAGNEQMFMANNFQAFLAKPINIMNLDFIVQRWVRDKSKE